jgi:hypothetical protein
MPFQLSQLDLCTHFPIELRQAENSFLDFDHFEVTGSATIGWVTKIPNQNI